MSRGSCGWRLWCRMLHNQNSIHLGKFRQYSLVHVILNLDFECNNEHGRLSSDLETQCSRIRQNHHQKIGCWMSVSLFNWEIKKFWSKVLSSSIEVGSQMSSFMTNCSEAKVCNWEMVLLNLWKQIHDPIWMRIVTVSIQTHIHGDLDHQ